MNPIQGNNTIIKLPEDKINLYWASMKNVNLHCTLSIIKLSYHEYFNTHLLVNIHCTYKAEFLLLFNS